MIIPGFIISIFTFPGVIVHELAHQLFCYLCGLKVYEVKYFQCKNPCGYVIHEASGNPFSTLLISIGPFIVNTLLGMLIVFPASVEIFVFNDFRNVFNLIMLWLGISILMHAFPSVQDGKIIVEQVLKNKEVDIFFKILTAPVIFLIYLGAYGSVVWLDAVYAVAVAMLLPKLLVFLF